MEGLQTMSTAKKTKVLQIDGYPVLGEYLGKGLFTKAYRAGDIVYLLVKEDMSKEAIALFADKTLRHIPRVNRHEDIGEYQVFSMPYYQKLTKKTAPRAWEQWQVLNSIGTFAVGPCTIMDVIKQVERKGYTSLALALQDLFDAFSNYDHDGMVMEWNKANVSVDQHGDLVLRDCLCSQNSVKRIRDARRKRHESRYQSRYSRFI